MEPIIKELIAGVVVIIACGTSFIVAWIESKKRKLEEAKHLKTKSELASERNGFRTHVYEEIVKLNGEVKGLKTDMKLIKNLVVENKVHYKELEGKKK